MPLLVTVFKLALKAKMVKDGIALIDEVLPTPVKSAIAHQVTNLGGKLQDGAADLLASHAPEFSKKLARKAEPEKAKQSDTLTDIQGQLAQLTQALQKAQNGEPVTKPATTVAKTKSRKPAKAG